MTLVVHELDASGVIQELTPSRNVIVESVRPHLYKHGSVVGSLKMQILDSDSNLLGESEALEINDIGTLPYFHGYVQFDVNVYLAKDTTYKLKLVGSDGYTYSDAAYVGWCNGFDLGKYPADYVTDGSFTTPLDIEVWERTVR